MIKPWRLLDDTLSGATKHPLSALCEGVRADQTDRFPIGLERDVFDAESGGGAAIAAAIAEAEKVTVRDYVTDMCALLRPDCRWDGIRQGQARTAAEQILSVSEVAPAPGRE